MSRDFATELDRAGLHRLKPQDGTGQRGFPASGSPTSPTLSPWRTAKLTPFTALLRSTGANSRARGSLYSRTTSFTSSTAGPTLAAASRAGLCEDAVRSAFE